MAYFKKFILIGFITTLALIVTGCSDDKDNNDNAKKEASGDHIWKTQTDTLKTAKEMTKKMQESLKQQQQTLEEND